MITIIDLGIGNTGSIQNMISFLGGCSQVTADIDAISKSEKLILAGVGAFDSAMEQINKNNLSAIIDQKVIKEKIPLLGICLGMQLLCDSSAEGQLPGLGYIPGKVCSFHDKEEIIHNKHRVPHMGWNNVKMEQKSPLLNGMDSSFRFYFVHSYYVECPEKYNILSSFHGFQFSCAIQNENIFGVQFHPEKSHRYGKQLFRNFLNL